MIIDMSCGIPVYSDYTYSSLKASIAMDKSL